ncbi:hypothetical protein Tco_0732139 [Tanacetum coccineum]
MAAPVISISLNVSIESVRSSFPRVIVIGSISVEVPVAPKVGAAAVASPARVLEIDTHSSSKVDPSKSSPPPVSVAPMVLPFLCSDDSELDIEIPERHVTPTPHEAMLTRLRSRVALRSSSPTTSTPKIPTAPILPAPSAIIAPSSEFPLTHVPCCYRNTRALVPSHADLLPPRKRFKDSISLEDGVEEDIDMDVLEDIEADATAVEVVVDRDVMARVDVGIDMEVDVGVNVEDEAEDEVKSSDRGTMEVRVDVATRIDIPDAMLMPDAVEHLEQVEEGLQDIYDHVIEIPLQRIKDIETGQKELEFRSLITGGERASLLEQVASLERSNVRLQGTMMMERARADRLLVEPINITITYSCMNLEVIEELINRRVEEALVAYEATCAANALEAESQSQNGRGGDNGNGGDGNGGNGNGNGNGENGHPNKNNRDARPVVRECTYQDFMKC